MESKKIILAGLVIGSLVGGYLPSLWGGATFSMSALFFGFLGGLTGIFVGYKIGQS